MSKIVLQLNLDFLILILSVNSILSADAILSQMFPGTNFHHPSSSSSYFLESRNNKPQSNYKILSHDNNLHRRDNNLGRRKKVLKYQKSSPKFDDDPMMNPGMYQGDIIGPLPDENQPLIMKNFIWPDGVIPYQISGDLESKTFEIENAMQEIQAKTCIRFRRRKSADRDFVNLTAGSGCSSSVGRRGGRQTLSLGSGCHSHGIIVHELMHAIGFYHLHQRSDRDNYLNIHWDNIQPSVINNFAKMPPGDLRVDAVFDYDSVMLYGDTTFSKDKVSKTMTPTIYGVTLLPPAKKYGLSNVDAMSINRLYGCKNYYYE